jgi:hypothetical protein
VKPMDRKSIPPLWQSGGKGAAGALSRRAWLRAFAGLCGTLSIAPAIGLSEPRYEEANPQDWLRHFAADFLADGAALRRIGADYLASHPRERNRERLSRLLCRDERAPVRFSLIENIARDWFEHDVVVVQGWVLARTEARICAVLHLMDGAGE